jgi:glycosyltransferase involved in cell wall biosynthesis
VVSLEKGLTGLCVPSKTYGYMMQGLALLAIVGPSDIARDAQSGAGICVENGNGEALAEKIRALCDDPATLGSMKQKCRQLYLANYKTEICTAKYVDLMRENILGEKA